MPLSIRRIRELIGYNRRDINGLRETLDRKLISFIGWLYRNLELGPAWERRLQTRLAGRHVPEIVEALRPVVERLSDVVRAGRSSARGYASMIVKEYDSAREIEELDIKLPKIKDDLEYFRAAVSLKREREIPFLEDLLKHLLSYLPVERKGIAETERVLGLVRKRLEDLLKMVGTLTGHVYDADTKLPIEGALVEIADYGVLTDAEGHYRIDWITAEKHRAKCSHDRYEPQEEDIEIKGATVTIKDWYLKKPPVPKVWKYTLRISARVVRGIAPGTSPKVRPKTVRRQVTLTGETIDLVELKHGRRVKERSPIFCELSFESFISSLFERELEDTYKQPLIDIVKGYSSDIATSANFESVELEEWDFLRESKEEIEFKEDKSRDYYEINMYLPSSYSKLIADGYYEHDVGEKERKGEVKKEGEGVG